MKGLIGLGLAALLSTYSPKATPEDITKEFDAKEAVPITRYIMGKDLTHESELIYDICPSIDGDEYLLFTDTLRARGTLFALTLSLDKYVLRSIKPIFGNAKKGDDIREHKHAELYRAGKKIIIKIENPHGDDYEKVISDLCDRLYNLNSELIEAHQGK